MFPPGGVFAVGGGVPVVRHREGSFVCGLLGSCTLEDNQELSERSQPILLQHYDSACELCFFLQREGN